MAIHFADELLAAIAAKHAPVCVGIDPKFESLPDELRSDGATGIDQLPAIEKYCMELLDVLAPIVPAIKPQSAYFERMGYRGVKLYEDVIARAHELGLLVIGDVKRNDIGSTAEAYALGHLAGLAGQEARAADAVTVNGYLGADGILPFVEQASKLAKGLFVLVRTSNPSAGQVQDVADADGRKLYEHLADQLAVLGSDEQLLGDSGYSCLGAVVGATWPEELAALRKAMPRQIILVPGYGAQGATAADAAGAFTRDGTGGIVNASRSVIYAHRSGRYAGQDWKKAVQSAAGEFARDVHRAVSRAGR